ncbi:MAG: hypothetical protein ACJAS1_001468 [Oleiphilaceae bacterium]|jgi:hypothetical protein
MQKIISAAILTSILSLPLTLHADTGFGIGVTYVFDSGMAVGVKVFADDEEYEVEASAGIDYMLDSGALRPNIGVAYLGDNNYVDLNVGYNLKNKSRNFGVGVGFVDTEKEKVTAAPVAAPVAAPAPAPAPAPTPDT